jgi:hypothetical protein
MFIQSQIHFTFYGHENQVNPSVVIDVRSRHGVFGGDIPPFQKLL